MRLCSTPGLAEYAVPNGFALTVDFFEPWVDRVQGRPSFAEADRVKKEFRLLQSSSKFSGGDRRKQLRKELERLCDEIKKEICDCDDDDDNTNSSSSYLKLNDAQTAAVTAIRDAMRGSRWNGRGAAVRSSAPDEDGAAYSFAGAFETVLNVTPDGLVRAIRRCFASLFDYRVFSYCAESATNNGVINDTNEVTAESRKPAFAAIVMEMVDATKAGVAFSANPMNSDLDELVVDCSYGLGVSVVDGLVVADRYVYDKVNQKVLEVAIGSKETEKRLRSDGGGVQSIPVDESRRKLRTLSNRQLDELCRAICLIEKTYGMPLDVEFAYANEGLKLLQARPITTNFTLDDAMVTQPGERRVLYYDFNIASEATTTEPFTHLDLELYCRMSSVMMTGSADFDMFSNDPRMLMFNASTRQYFNLSLAFRWFSPEYFSKKSILLDPYISHTFASSDCDRKKYKADRMPKEVNLCNAIRLLRKIPMLRWYKKSRKYISRPEEAKKEYVRVTSDCRAKLDQIHERGIMKEKGLEEYVDALFKTLMPEMDEELSLIFFLLLPTFDKLDKKRRSSDSKTAEDYEALCGGFEGDGKPHSGCTI